ncbi:MAG: PAS domain-containing sensor histidine kinase [Bacteroidota bacterium]|nr:PAS domain-containing sensor histidine kinase [Bacteroidota bacterium]MDP4190192.1 PAS domain-containing sensor histidine kinase [Bacteroidota bacterium]MDP4193791.1 PAS domain-containing sensor histidine kinase [Bacteroidota bacterium]
MSSNSQDSEKPFLQNPKRFNSIKDFKSLEEFPDTKSMAIADCSGNIIYANHSFELSFHLKEGDNFGTFESEPNINSLIEGLSLSKYSSFHCDLFYFRNTSGASPNFYVEVERILVNESDFFVFIFSSLEERQKLESKINTLHNALEFGNVPVIITDSDGRITYSTKSFEKILNTTIEFLYSRNIIDVLSNILDHPDLEDLRVKIAGYEKCTKVVSDINDDGSLSYIELTINPVKRDDVAAEAMNFIITANDITNYVQKNRIIKRSEERQKSIINNISDLLLIVRSEKGNLYFENANDNFYEVFSLKREKAMEKNIEDIFDKHFHLILTQAINNLTKFKNAYQEFRYKNYIIDREYLGSITFTDDHYEEQRIFIISLKDITEQLINDEKLRKAYQKETHVNKLKSSFLANMSHEIRTPLNAIVGYSELIEDDVKSGSIDSAIEFFPYLKEGFNRLLSLVDNILEVSLIQSGETELDIVSTNVASVLKAVYRNMMHFALDKTMIFDIDIEDEELSIKADRIKLEKIVNVLVDNAIKYTDRNGKVKLKCYYDETAKITISDTGKGIAQENLTRMFEPFAQEDEGHTRKYEGAGLGLTIAYNLTKLMGGELIVDSIINEGTIITLSFPCSLPAN